VFSGINQAGTVAAMLAMMDGGVQVMSTHGDSYFGGAPAGQEWGWDGNEAQVAILTREAVTAGSIGAHAIELLTGQLVVDAAGDCFAYLPSFVTTQRAGNPMDNSLVYVGACRSSFNDTMAAAYLAAGAAYFVGYTEYVNSDYAHDRGKLFFADMLDRDNTGAAYATMSTPWVPDDAQDPAYPVAWGDADLYLGMGKLSNGGFEDGLIKWKSDGQSSAETGMYFKMIPMTKAPEGTQAAMMTIEAPDSNYHQLSHVACPIPGKQYSISFKWQIVHEAVSCDWNGPNWLNFRIDTDEGNHEEWVVLFPDVCDLMSSTGWGHLASGWQDATVIFTAPETANPGNELLTFSIGGWNYDAWTGMLDDVKWE